MNSAELYNRKEIWGRPLEAYQRNVLRDILRLLPEDVQSILDVGCGDGLITNALPENIRVVGFDVGEASLSHIKRETMIGTATALPYKDGEFDLVMANDVIEHIPDGDYQKVLSEIQRVAKRFIIITVPFMENLNSARTFCTKCGTTYHVNHHQRAYGVTEMPGLFRKGWLPCTIVFSGASTNPLEIVQREIKGMLGLPSTWDAAICPACGEQASAILMDKNLEAEANVRPLELPLQWPSVRPNRSECMALFCKEAGVQPPADSTATAKIAFNLFTSTGQHTMPGNIALVDNHLVFQVQGEHSTPDRYITLEYHDKGTCFRLPEPERIPQGAYIIPLWFLPGQLLNCSATSDQSLKSLLMLLATTTGQDFRKFRNEATNAINELSGSQAQIIQTQTHQLEKLLQISEALSSLSQQLKSKT